MSRSRVVRDRVSRRESVLQAVAFAASEFLRSDRLEECVPAVLGRLGEASAASRVYVFECHDGEGRRRWSQRFEWAAPGVEPQIDNPILQDVVLEEIGFGRWERLLSRGGVIHGRVETFPSSERDLLIEQGIAALLAMPIFVRERWWGFIGFDDCERGSRWPPAVVTALGTAADLFGAMLERRELEDRFHCLTEAVGEGVLIHDGERILEVNPRALQMIGYEREEVVGRDPFTFMDPLSADAARERARAGTTEPYEVALLRRDGTPLPVEIRGGVARFDGRAVRVVSIVDLTARKEAARNERALLLEQIARGEAQLGEEKARFLAEASRILASSFDYSTTLASVAQMTVHYLGGFCMVDVLEDDRIERIATAHAVGEEKEALCELAREIPDPENESSPVVRVLRTAEAVMVECTTGDGCGTGDAPASATAETAVPRCHSIIFVPIRLRGTAIGVISVASPEPGRHFTAEELRLVQDLADRASLAMENARLYAEAQAATRTRDEVLAVVAHDLRNPVGAIMGGAAMIHELAEVEAVRRFAEIIRRSADRMNRLIQDLLEVSRVERGALTLEIADVEAGQLVEEALATLAPIAEPRSLRLLAELPDSLPVIRADGARLLQVFSNLLGNAIKFTPEGGTIVVSAVAESNAVRFTVSDSGPGIPPEMIPHLFARFWQADSADRRGAGLGLSIVKGIVEAHGGRIWVVSEVGVGSTFHFSVPLAAAVHPEAGMAARLIG